MKKKIKSLIAYVVLIAPVIARSHPGHGEGGGDFSFMHYFTEPWHAPVLLILLGVASAVLATWLLSGRRMRRTNRPGR
ncbi:hypothetical protein MJD09_14260 [bacterium]|nr:hypothetical protein [bacterium]